MTRMLHTQPLVSTKSFTRYGRGLAAPILPTKGYDGIIRSSMALLAPYTGVSVHRYHTKFGIHLAVASQTTTIGKLIVQPICT